MRRGKATLRFGRFLTISAAVALLTFALTSIVLARVGNAQRDTSVRSAAAHLQSTQHSQGSTASHSSDSGDEHHCDNDGKYRCHHHQHHCDHDGQYQCHHHEHHHCKPHGHYHHKPHKCHHHHDHD